MTFKVASSNPHIWVTWATKSSLSVIFQIKLNRLATCNDCFVLPKFNICFVLCCSSGSHAVSTLVTTELVLYTCVCLPFYIQSLTDKNTLQQCMIHWKCHHHRYSKMLQDTLEYAGHLLLDNTNKSDQ